MQAKEPQPQAPARTLDLRAERCPMTFVQTRLALEPLEIGVDLRVLLRDPESVRNVPRSLEAEGCDVHDEQHAPDGTLAFSVHKTKSVRW
jgi:tRNA 2-thiouridine synthesizing protein A